MHDWLIEREEESLKTGVFFLPSPKHVQIKRFIQCTGVTNPFREWLEKLKDFSTESALCLFEERAHLIGCSHR